MIRSLLQRFFQKEFLLYLFVGFSTFALDYFLYWFLLDAIHIWYLLSQIIVVPIVLAFNYYGHRRLTFSTQKEEKMQVKKYLLLSAFNFFVSVSSLYVLVSFLGIDALIAKMCTMALIVMYNYFALKWLVFEALPSPAE